MEISINPLGIREFAGSALLIGLQEGALDKNLDLLKEKFGYSFDKVLEKENFKGKRGDLTSFNFLEGQIEKLIIIGLGEKDHLRIDDLRKEISKAIKNCSVNGGTLGILLPRENLEPEKVIKALGESCRLSFFKDLRYRSSPDPIRKAPKIELLGFDENYSKYLQDIEAVCSGVELARELVGAPPCDLTPNALAETAKKIANDHKINCKILSQKECEKLEMGAYLAVSKGSDLEPKFIHLIYKSEGPIKNKLVMIGKGLTFDSGGYNLKVGAAQIDLMKFDMGGSAAVLGAAKAIAQIKPKAIEVHFIIASCENMINGSALHPGDIITASNGKTIEVNNTDAEGRLTLADALVYASKLNPDAIVDLATLTGACVIALGDEIAGLWTQNDTLAQQLQEASENAGEGIWRMPLYKPYKDGLKSMLADIKNTGPRAGGSITAALFLQEFVDSSISWAHIDIAGPVWSEKGSGGFPTGATGFGVKTLIEWACNEAQKENMP